MPEVVLLGGASNAGKTTVATRVALESKGRIKVFDYFELALKMQHLATDFFYFPDEVIFERGLTWDDPAAIDWSRVKGVGNQ